MADRGRFRIIHDRHPIIPGKRWLLLEMDSTAEEKVWNTVWLGATWDECLARLIHSWRSLTGEHVCTTAGGNPFVCAVCNVIVAQWASAWWQPVSDPDGSVRNLDDQTVARL